MSQVDIEFDEPKKREDIIGCKVARVEVDRATLTAQLSLLRFDKDSVVDSFTTEVTLTEADVAAIVAVVSERAVEQGKIPAGKIAGRATEPIVELEPTPL